MDTVIGASGHVVVHLITEQGDPYLAIEDERNGEIVELADLATAREIHSLLGQAILRVDYHLLATSSRRRA